MIRPLLFVWVLLWPSVARAAEQQTVFVRILERYVQGDLDVEAANSQERGYVHLRARGGAILTGSGRIVHGALTLGDPVAHGTCSVRYSGHERRYQGLLHVRAEGDRLVLINELPLESYVASVVASEMLPGWPLEALKAQAILARTFALKGGDHESRGLCDLTHCQVYAGKVTPQSIEAAQATRGLVLEYGGHPISPLYHAACGGMRASNQVVFGGLAVPYLREEGDRFCLDSPYAKPWKVRVTSNELSRALGVPAVETVSVLDRDAGGWVARVLVDRKKITGYHFWQAIGRQIGWGGLKSLRFTVSKQADGFEFAGKGLGHGVGLCQWGARGRALAGWSYRRILASYYPGTSLRRM